MLREDATDQQVLDCCLKFPYQNLTGAVVVQRKGEDWTLHTKSGPAMRARRMR